MSFNALGDIESSIPVSPLHLAVSVWHGSPTLARHQLVLPLQTLTDSLARQADRGHWQALQVLTETAAYVDMQDAAGRSVLYLAAQKGFARCVEVLLAQGASCLLNDNSLMWTPIHVTGASLNACVRRKDIGKKNRLCPNFSLVGSIII